MTVTKDGYETWSQTVDLSVAGVYIVNVTLKKTAAPSPTGWKWIVLGVVIGLALFLVGRKK